MKEIRKRLKKLLPGYQIGYDDGLMFGSDVGYEIAMDELTSVYKVRISIVDDFFQFRNQLENLYGAEYVTQADLLFKKTVHLHKEYPTYLAAEPIYAKSIAYYQKGNHRIIHLVLFLIEKNLEIETFDSLGRAKTYTKIAINLLNNDEDYYEPYFKKIAEFKTIILQKEWDRN